jgi:hypothetical protein
MTKTFTPENPTNFAEEQSIPTVSDETEQQNELFYNSIKPQLNQLIKDPSDETINKILAYSRKK